MRSPLMAMKCLTNAVNIKNSNFSMVLKIAWWMMMDEMSEWRANVIFYWHWHCYCDFCQTLQASYSSWNTENLFIERVLLLPADFTFQCLHFRNYHRSKISFKRILWMHIVIIIVIFKRIKGKWDQTTFLKL